MGAEWTRTAWAGALERLLELIDIYKKEKISQKSTADDAFFNCPFVKSMFSICSCLVMFFKQRRGHQNEPINLQGKALKERGNDMHNKNINTDINTKKDTAAPLKLDTDAHRHHFAEFNMTVDQQNELLQALWYIMSTLVDIGWGVDTVQMLLPDIYVEVAPDCKKLVKSKNTSQFEQATDTEKGKEND